LYHHIKGEAGLFMGMENPAFGALYTALGPFFTCFFNKIKLQIKGRKIKSARGASGKFPASWWATTSLRHTVDFLYSLYHHTVGFSMEQMQQIQ